MTVRGKVLVTLVCVGMLLFLLACGIAVVRSPQPGEPFGPIMYGSPK